MDTIKIFIVGWREGGGCYAQLTGEINNLLKTITEF